MHSLPVVFELVAKHLGTGILSFPSRFADRVRGIKPVHVTLTNKRRFIIYDPEEPYQRPLIIEIRKESSDHIYVRGSAKDARCFDIVVEKTI